MECNPWLVENVEVFRLYCCPECSEKYPDCQDFEHHALNQHPKSKFLFNVKLKQDSEDFPSSDSIQDSASEEENKPITSVSDLTCYNVKLSLKACSNWLCICIKFMVKFLVLAVIIQMILILLNL